jgi:AraC-like DNA-binding protein
MSGTHLATSARFLWRILETHGCHADAVFRGAGLDPALLTDPRARYPIERVAAAWEAASAAVRDPCFGLEAVDAWRPSDYHAMGYAMLASRSLRRALERLARYFRIINDQAGVELVETPQSLGLRYLAPPTGFGLAPLQEMARWASILGICRTLYDGPLDPVEVAMRQPAPPCPERIDACFRCPVRFAQAATGIAFDKQVADRLLVASNRELAAANDRIAIEYLGRLQRDDVLSRVKAAILDHLPSGLPNDEHIAQALHMSTRTLQRKLKDEGTTFSDAIESVRRELAEAYIRDQNLSFTEISFLLGFGDTSSFTRAFKRWTGQTPSAQRQQLA